MRKLCAILLLVAYVAFVPVCFASPTQGVAHVHEGGASGAGDNAHDTSSPLSAHTQMYDIATSAKFAEHVLLALDIPTTYFVLASFIFLFYVTRVTTLRTVDRYRMARRALAYRQTFLRYLTRFIASPNFRFALA